MKFRRKTGKKIACVCMAAVLLAQNISVTETEKCVKNIETESSKYADIAKFPESYQSKLRELKKKHPNWKFEKVSINLSWDSVIKHESAPGANTIVSNVPKGGASGTYSAPLSYLSTKQAVYDAYNDKYKVIDSTNRYTPNEQVVGYYMDPRNFLTEEQIFQFESLKYESNQSIEGVRQILSGTFMSGDYTYIVKKKKKVNKTIKKNGKKVTKKVIKTVKEKETKNYAETFYEAGKTYKINPYLLAIRVRQEVGTTLSTATRGTCDGYEGYYNFYNIGATDSSDGTAALKGLHYAKMKGDFGRPWNSQYKAILGGAEYIAQKYIAVGQNTFYFQKFSVVNKSYRYWHQYMSNIEAAKDEAKKMYHMYQSKGMLNKERTFRIPVYNNMPKTAVSLPKAGGSTNNYMKVIKISSGGKKFSLVTAKNYKKKTFGLNVPYAMKRVRIIGKTSNKNAKVTGCDKIYELEPKQVKVISLTVKAQNGTTRKYNIRIRRLGKKKAKSKKQSK